MARKKLTKQEEKVILHKGTEAPFTGEYWNFHGRGIYACRQCGNPLFRSADKFDSRCGWPSFDDAIEGAVKTAPDADGTRTEIICAACGGHLGHVFAGEGLTAKNTRHCVNSLSLDFIPATERAIFASGCFWGAEYYFQRAKGVISTRVGYIGGHKDSPTYKDVCTGTTGHAEAVEVVFEPARISYEELVKLFFETHDPTQINRQGPDVGEQYRSAIFTLNEGQKETAERLINILKDKGYAIATEVKEAADFWPAEDYHQKYYEKSGDNPYCHRYLKRF